MGHNGTPATDGSSPPRSETRTGHGAGESAAHRIAAREGEGSTPSSRPKSPRAPYKLTGPTRAAATELKAAASDSRPPEFAPDLDPRAALLLRVEPAGPTADLRLNAPSSSASAPREVDDAVQAALLPVGGEDVTHTQEENH